MADKELREQVVSQLMCVRSLAQGLSDLHGDKAVMYAGGAFENLLEMVGRESARLMETLGDVLNGVDAVNEEDSRFDQTFEEAHRRWPSEGCSHCGALPTPPHEDQSHAG